MDLLNSRTGMKAGSTEDFIQLRPHRQLPPTFPAARTKLVDPSGAHQSEAGTRWTFRHHPERTSFLVIASFSRGFQFSLSTWW